MSNPVKTFMKNNLRTKSIVYLYDNEEYKLIEGGKTYIPCIGSNPTFYFPEDSNCMILVLDTEKNSSTLPIEKIHEYKNNNFPTEENIKSIIKNNQYSVIFKVWLDNLNNFQCEKLYQALF